MKNLKLLYLILSSVLVVFLLYISDQVIELTYIEKVLLKVSLFYASFVLYKIKTGDNILKSSFIKVKKRRFDITRIKASLILGISIFILILTTYSFLKQFINTSVLINEFEDKYRINGNNIIYYGAYLVFLNSFLEEFFFRGFIFLNIKRLGYRKLAYFISSLLFSVYHISNFQNWVNLVVFILALIGLFLGGCIFNYLDDKQETFFNSWFVHICADIAIVLIGLRIFKVI